MSFFFSFQIFLGVSLGVGIIAGLMTLCVFYLGLFVLGTYDLKLDPKSLAPFS